MHSCHEPRVQSPSPECRQDFFEILVRIFKRKGMRNYIKNTASAMDQADSVSVLPNWLHNGAAYHNYFCYFGLFAVE